MIIIQKSTFKWKFLKETHSDVYYILLSMYIRNMQALKERAEKHKLAIFDYVNVMFQVYMLFNNMTSTWLK